MTSHQPSEQEGNVPVQSSLMARLEAKPQTLTQLFESLKGEQRPPKKQLQIILLELVESGRIFEWAPKKNVVYYCDFSPAESVESAVFSALEKGDQTPKQLAVQARKKLPLFAAVHLEPFLKPQLEDGLIHYHPTQTGQKNPHYSLRGLNPADYLKTVVRQFQAAARKLEPAGFSPRRLLQVLTRELDLAYKPSEGVKVGQESSPDKLKARLMDEIKKSDPPVYIHNLRKNVEASKTDFDKAVITLAREGLIDLFFDDLPNKRNKSELEELVKSSAGTYYSVVALKGEQ